MLFLIWKSSGRLLSRSHLSRSWRVCCNCWRTNVSDTTALTCCSSPGWEALWSQRSLSTGYFILRNNKERICLSSLSDVPRSRKDCRIWVARVILCIFSAHSTKLRFDCTGSGAHSIRARLARGVVALSTLTLNLIPIASCLSFLKPKLQWRRPTGKSKLAACYETKDETCTLGIHKHKCFDDSL